MHRGGLRNLDFGSHDWHRLGTRSRHRRRHLGRRHRALLLLFRYVELICARGRNILGMLTQRGGMHCYGLGSLGFDSYDWHWLGTRGRHRRWHVGRRHCALLFLFRYMKHDPRFRVAEILFSGVVSKILRKISHFRNISYVNVQNLLACKD